MSMGFLVEEKSAIVWRGLMVSTNVNNISFLTVNYIGDVSHSKITTSSRLGKTRCFGG